MSCLLTIVVETTGVQNTKGVPAMLFPKQANNVQNQMLAATQNLFNHIILFKDFVISRRNNF